jgi:hypothetical protein
MEKEKITIKYLYVDDNDKGKESVQGFLKKDKTPTDVIETKENFELSIDVIKPTEKRKDIIKMLTDYDGLIVDQQLDEKPNSEGSVSDYLGSSLASDIRVVESGKIQNGEDASKPIILFSANPNVPSTLYSLGEEIFDLKIYKIMGDGKYFDFDRYTPMYKSQMISLVKGYEVLKELKAKEQEFKKQNPEKQDSNPPFICKSLKLDDNLNLIDGRFLDELKRRNDLTAHSKASFILNELIIKQGILVDEDILAVRLGIDRKKSQEGWHKVLTDLKEFKAEYQGVFCEGWPRWWMPMVEKWWSERMQEESYLQFLSASERVKIISQKLEIHLEVAVAESKFSDNDEYWTVCDFTKEPLAIENGLMIPGQDGLYPWQEAKYVSVMSAIEESLDVADFEQARLAYYRQLLKQSK